MIPAASERFLKIIAEETDRLGRLVEDILTIGEIEQKIANTHAEAKAIRKLKHPSRSDKLRTYLDNL